MLQVLEAVSSKEENMGELQSQNSDLCDRVSPRCSVCIFTSSLLLLDASKHMLLSSPPACSGRLAQHFHGRTSNRSLIG